MLHDNMNIYGLMVYAQQLEKTTIKRKSADSIRAKSFYGGSSKGRLDIIDKSRFKKMFSNQLPSKFPKAHDDNLSNPNPKKGRGTSSPTKNPTCRECEEKHYGDFLIVMKIALVVVILATR